MGLIFDLIRYNGNIPIPNGMYGFVYYFSQIVGILFMLFYFHQGIFLVIGTLKRHKIPNKVFKFHTIGVVIAARNESAVIGNLIKSIQANDYPQSMIKIFVVADNCTDNTAQICRDMGCVVFERFNKEKIGKGYALNYLFTKLHTEPEFANMVPEAYIVLDADNIIKPNYITEMNKMYDSGYDMATSYRNTKNFGDNWISSGYGFWFLHEARHNNNARMHLKSSCAISGTGFLISQDVVKEYNNWEFFLLTEDIQCSTEYALSGRKVGYTDTAEFFDEQPTKFKQAWRQRQRWAKGSFQITKAKGGALLKRSFTSFSCWDVFTATFPAFVLTFLSVVVFPLCAIISLCMGDFANVGFSFLQLLWQWAGLCVTMWAISGTILITEWKRIICPNWKKVLYAFIFPLYMLTYIPISISALFKKVEWKPIIHSSKVTLEDLNKPAEKDNK